jgi:hypothetical protein
MVLENKKNGLSADKVIAPARDLQVSRAAEQRNTRLYYRSG